MPPITLPPPSPSLPTDLLGMWVLQSREDYDAQGHRHNDPALGPHPLGIVTFAPGRFAAQFMNPDRSAVLATPRVPTNNTSAINGYDGYFGTYTVDLTAGTIATRLEGAVTATNIGQVFTRSVRVVGDQLFIQLATTAPDGTAVTRTLVFNRAT
jgi:hypothetical protein